MKLVLLMLLGITMPVLADDCHHIVNPQSKSMCRAVEKRDTSYCYDIRDSNTKSYCMALASGNSSYCSDITDSNARTVCQSKF